MPKPKRTITVARPPDGARLTHDAVYRTPPHPCIGDVISFADGVYRVVGRNHQGQPVLVRIGQYDDASTSN